MICRKRRGSEEGQARCENHLPPDAVRKRTGEKGERGRCQRIAGNHNARLSRSRAQILGYEREQRGNQLGIGNPQKQNAEENERHLPLELCTFGHARILTSQRNA